MKLISSRDVRNLRPYRRCVVRKVNEYRAQLWFNELARRTLEGMRKLSQPGIPFSAEHVARLREISTQEAQREILEHIVDNIVEGK